MPFVDFFRDYVPSDWQRWLAIGLIVLVGLLLVVTGVNQTRDMITLFGAKESAAEQDKLAAVKLGPGRQPVSKSPGRYLFGKHTAVEESITLTNSSLSLTGVFVSSDPKTAAAVIAENDDPEELYVIGDKVPGGGVLDQVLADRVILKRNGRLETLMMAQDDTTNESVTGTTDFEIPDIEPEDLDIDYDNPEELRDIEGLRSKILKGYGIDKMLDNLPDEQRERFKHLRDF